MNKNIVIALAADHAGFELKEYIRKYLDSLNYTYIDFGTHSTESMDYPDVIHPLCLAIQKQKADVGIIFCGSGNGVNMTANKHQGIRSALCWIPEIAKLAREHNNANVIALPARFINEFTAKHIVDAFLSSEFEGGRHQRRVDKIESCI
ncbi:MAG: ribose 5-phosphate isomerase B [Flavobacteriales bacterium]|nr:ribose 5-phosphate isomerase B [Flavobacteriales bacterium]